MKTLKKSLLSLLFAYALIGIQACHKDNKNEVLSSSEKMLVGTWGIKHPETGELIPQVKFKANHKFELLTLDIPNVEEEENPIFTPELILKMTDMKWSYTEPILKLRYDFPQTLLSRQAYIEVTSEIVSLTDKQITSSRTKVKHVGINSADEVHEEIVEDENSTLIKIQD